MTLLPHLNWVSFCMVLRALLELRTNQFNLQLCLVFVANAHPSPIKRVLLRGGVRAMFWIRYEIMLRCTTPISSRRDKAFASNSSSDKTMPFEGDTKDHVLQLESPKLLSSKLTPHIGMRCQRQLLLKQLQPTRACPHGVGMLQCNTCSPMPH